MVAAPQMQVETTPPQHAMVEPLPSSSPLSSSPPWVNEEVKMATFPLVHRYDDEGEEKDNGKEKGENERVNQIRRMEKRPLRKRSRTNLLANIHQADKIHEPLKKERIKSGLTACQKVSHQHSAPELDCDSEESDTQPVGVVRPRSFSDPELSQYLAGGSAAVPAEEQPEHHHSQSCCEAKKKKKHRKPQTEDACVEEINSGRMWLASNFGFVLYMYDKMHNN